jgi:hypothetical protein
VSLIGIEPQKAHWTIEHLASLLIARRRFADEAKLPTDWLADSNQETPVLSILPKRACDSLVDSPRVVAHLTFTRINTELTFP